MCYAFAAAGVEDADDVTEVVSASAEKAGDAGGEACGDVASVYDYVASSAVEGGCSEL